MLRLYRNQHKFSSVATFLCSLNIGYSRYVENIIRIDYWNVIIFFLFIFHIICFYHSFPIHFSHHLPVSPKLILCPLSQKNQNIQATPIRPKLKAQTEGSKKHILPHAQKKTMQLFFFLAKYFYT